MRVLSVILSLALSVGVMLGADSPLPLKDLEGVVHRPFEKKGTKAVVVVFVSTDCPIANYYQPTLQRLQKEFGSKGVTFFQVHPDTEVPIAELRKHRKEFAVKNIVVIDRDQRVTKRLAATTTPEAFVITRGDAVVYRGRIDDTYTAFGKRRPKPSTHELRDALEAVVAGKAPKVTKSKPVGCRIFIEK